MSKTTSINDNPILQSKIDETCAGLQLYIKRHLESIPNQNNTITIIRYISTMKIETNLSDHYRKDLLDLLYKFSCKVNHKEFSSVTRDDIILFLDTFRKSETLDPLHKWIGTYNIFRTHLIRFFRWLYSQDKEQKNRSIPSVIENIPRLRRKEVSIYKPSDLWTQQDDLLFLKYCSSLRDKCYHAMSRDLSCRPHELLKLKIRDVSFKTIGASQYAEVVVNGKTGTRAIPLINSIPYLKDYLDHAHPQPTNPNCALICGLGRGLGRHIGITRIAVMYFTYKKQIFPRLLELPDVSPEDKVKIKELLKKPWNPYIRRHSALTEKSKILKEHVLRQHSGWSQRSQMHLKYLHYFGNESSESLLEAYGLIDHGIQINQLSPKQCPNCTEPNKPDSKFCTKCRMVLTYDAYAQTIQQEDMKSKEMVDVMARIDELESRILGGKS